MYSGALGALWCTGLHWGALGCILVHSGALGVHWGALWCIDVDFGAEGGVTESYLSMDKCCFQVTNSLGLVSFVVVEVIFVIGHLKHFHENYKF